MPSATPDESAGAPTVADQPALDEDELSDRVAEPASAGPVEDAEEPVAGKHAGDDPANTSDDPVSGERRISSYPSLREASSPQPRPAEEDAGPRSTEIVTAVYQRKKALSTQPTRRMESNAPPDEDAPSVSSQGSAGAGSQPPGSDAGVPESHGVASSSAWARDTITLPVRSQLWVVLIVATVVIAVVAAVVVAAL